MRLSKEIIVLLVLLAGTMAFVLWYVADRKAKQRAEQNQPLPPATSAPLTHTAPTAPTVNLTDSAHDGKTINFSSGTPVVSDSPEDRATMQAALADISAAAEAVSFAPSKAPAPTAAPKP